LTVGYGLSADESFPALLAKEGADRGVRSHLGRGARWTSSLLRKIFVEVVAEQELAIRMFQLGFVASSAKAGRAPAAGERSPATVPTFGESGGWRSAAGVTAS
jgi:hypothetical protein